MRKLFTLLFVLTALALPCIASAATVSGTLTQISNHSTRQLEGITILLESKDGSVSEAVTDDNGHYRFTSVNQGEHRIEVKLPSDHVPAMMNEDNWLLPAQKNKAFTDWFMVDGNKTIDLASTRATVYIKFAAFVDENSNGGRKSNEAALSNVEVTLYSAEHPDLAVASGTTDRKGQLTLDDLSPANYVVKVVYPQNYSAGPLGLKVNQFYNCIKPSDSQEAWSVPFMLASGSQGIGIGAVVTGSAQGKVWFDADNDGKKSAGEGGLGGVNITMISEDGSLTRTAKTDESGNYTFNHLQPGNYTVRVTAPEGYMFTKEGGDSWLTEGYSDTDEGKATVKAEKTILIPDVGLMQATSLNMIFYRDSNGNGAFDADESAYDQGEIILARDGKTIAQISTDASGKVSVPIIRAGKLQIVARVMSGDIFSPAGPDNSFALPVAGAQSSLEIDLEPGKITDFYAAVTLPAQAGGTVFMDSDNDGVRSAQDQPAEGFTVQAIDNNGQVAASVVTDVNGSYYFDALLPVPHTFRFLLNDPYISSPYSENGNRIVEQNTDYGETAPYPLAPGSFTPGIDAGLFKAGTISGRVLLTDDRPAGMGAGLAGVEVFLIHPDGSLVADYTDAVSEEDGSYYLKGILPGEYRLRYELPEDALFAETDELSIESDAFTSAMGTDLQMADIFAVRTARITGQVLCEGEPMNAAITALNTENGITISANADAAAEGRFELHLLRPGHWRVAVTLEEGYSFAEDTDLVPAIAEHVSEKEYTFVMGDALDGQKILVTRPATMTGRVFLDENLSATWDEDEKPFTGHTILLVNRDGNTAAELTADENGCFVSPKLIPGKYQVTLPLEDDCILLNGSQVTEDKWYQEVEAVSGQNTDAQIPVLQFASISGKLWSLDESLDFVSGHEVQLFKAEDPSTPIAVTKTNKQGEYQFARLYPGEYRLSVTLPEGHGFARKADVNEERVSLILSNDDPKVSDILRLHMGLNIANADFGFGAKGSIGDLAWLDLNENGMQDIGEPGIPGIKIQLIQDGEVLAEAETDIYGHYMLEGLYPGHYTLRAAMQPELKSTVHQTEFPLIGSVLPESEETEVDAEDVIVPSGTRNLSVDLGFRLREEGKYPSVMDTIPTTDWSFGGKKR